MLNMFDYMDEQAHGQGSRSFLSGRDAILNPKNGRGGLPCKPLYTLQFPAAAEKPRGNNVQTKSCADQIMFVRRSLFHQYLCQLFHRHLGHSRRVAAAPGVGGAADGPKRAVRVG